MRPRERSVRYANKLNNFLFVSKGNMPNSNIILSQGDNLIIDASRGTLTKKFPHLYASKGARIGLLSLSIYNSWDNVSASFGNLTGASYLFDGVSYPVDYLAGNYSIEQLNDYLEHRMDLDGNWLLNDEGQKVFFLKFETNETYYSVTITVTPVPTALPAGWSNPNGLALSGDSPQLVVADTNWRRLIGLEAGTYPSAPATVKTRINGTAVPVISEVTSILVLCDWCNNSRFSSNGQVIGTFVANVGVGELVSISPSVVTTYDVISRMYDGITIRLVDQSYRPLQIKDASNLVITLLLEEAE